MPFKSYGDTESLRYYRGRCQGLEGAGTIGPRSLDLVHRVIRKLDKLLGLGRVLRAQRNADAGADIVLFIPDDNGLCNRLHDPFGKQSDGRSGFEIGQDDQELVASPAG